MTIFSESKSLKTRAPWEPHRRAPRRGAHPVADPRTQPPRAASPHPGAAGVRGHRASRRGPHPRGGCSRAGPRAPRGTAAGWAPAPSSGPRPARWAPGPLQRRRRRPAGQTCATKQACVSPFGETQHGEEPASEVSGLQRMRTALRGPSPPRSHSGPETQIRVLSLHNALALREPHGNKWKGVCSTCLF